jgi:single-stranded-DNA-specific exonuclease
VPGSETLSSGTSSSPPDILLRLLAGRGISDPESLERYFNPSLKSLASPDGLTNAGLAAQLILDADGEIVVFGDYDCDGVCATAIIVGVLKALGKEVSAFLPERLKEGYGMSGASVSRMLETHPRVRMVITVDNGVNSVEEVAVLKEKGISVVVTDHHLPGAVLPAADALVNPKVASSPELGDLCGAGVAFMLSKVLVDKAQERGLYAGPKLGGPLLVLAGLATVTDLMPVLGQNRILVHEALRLFHTCAPLGLRELFDKPEKAMTSRDFGFMLGPRINAAGRIASGMEALELILCSDVESARDLAGRVAARNDERKNIEQEMVRLALEKIVPGASAQVIDLPGGHHGVAGIIASRVMEKLSSEEGGVAVPVCIVVDGRGSARAPAGLNIRDAMESCSDVLERFGGHAAAGGFSVKPGKIDEFRERLCAYCRDFSASVQEGAGEAAQVDAWLSPEELTVELAGWVAKMEPFGEGNPEPVFGLRNVEFADVKPMGAEGRHLAVSFRNRQIPRAVWWNRGDKVEDIRASSQRGRNIAFKLSLSRYGELHVELILLSVFD